MTANMYMMRYYIDSVREGRAFYPPVDRPKDPAPYVLSLPGQFVGDPASLGSDNIYIMSILLSLV